MDVPRPTSNPKRTRRSLFGLSAASRGSEPSIPQVALVAATCLSMTGTTCRICAEHCGPNAIRFRLGLGGRSTPTVGEACDGCGACLPVCPVGALALIPKPETASCA